MSPRKLACFLGSVLVALATARAQQGGESLGRDAASAGRAGVDVAIADTAAALLANPAGLVQSRARWTLEGGGSLVWLRSGYRDAFQTEEVRDSRWLGAPTLALRFNPDPDDDGRAGDLHLAAAILHLEGYRSDDEVLTQDYPVDPGIRRRTDYVRTGLHLGAGLRLSSTVSVGLGLSLTATDLETETPLEIPVTKFQGLSPLGQTWGELLSGQLGVERVRIAGKLDAEPALGGFATLGLRWEITPELALGASWRSPGLQRDLDAEVDVDITRIFGEPDPVTFPDGFAVHYEGKLRDFRSPARAAIGLAWRPVPELRVAAQFDWIGWEGARSRLEIALRDGDNPGFNAFVGSDRLVVEQRFLWRDQIGGGVALEWDPVENWTFRVGFRAQSDPVRRNGGDPLAPGYTRFVVSAGLTWRGEGWALDIAWLRGIEREVKVATSLVTSDHDGSRQSLAVDAFLIGLRFEF
ncbi:MAG: outer membrane protein transport protein [Planctomycetota bacterium]